MSRALAVGLLLLAAERAEAGCGGLSGHALAECLEADQQRIQQAKVLEATTLHFSFNGTPFTISAARVVLSLRRGICGHFKKPGLYEHLDAATKKPFATTTCASIKERDQRPDVAAHGPYRDFLRRIEGTYWCGAKVGAWTTRDDRGAVVRTEHHHVNDRQAACEAPALESKLIKVEKQGWTLQ